MSKLQLYILLVIYVQNSSCVINNLSRIGNTLRKLYAAMDDLKLKETHNDTEVYDLFCYNADQCTISLDVKVKLDRIDERLREVERFMKPKIITDALGLVISDIMLSMKLDVLEQAIRSVDENYEEFDKHMDYTAPHSAKILEELTRNIIIKVEGKIEIIRNIITDVISNNQTLLSVITMEATKLYKMTCDNAKTISDTLVLLFQMVIIAELKVNVMLIFVNTYRYSHNAGWKDINRLASKQFEEQFAKYTLAFQKYISETDSLYLRRCDPSNGWIEDQSFIQFDRTFQETIFHYDRNTCTTYSCNDIRSSYSDYCNVKYYNRRTGCQETSTQCFWLDSIDTCIEEYGSRVFKYVNSSIGFYGKYSECNRNKDQMKIVDWETERSVCACYCSGNFLISLQLVESDWRNNKVITGLRFVRVWRTLYIQVREGELKAHGFVDQKPSDEDGWKPVPTDPYTETVNINTRIFFLDDLRLPADYALIGANFIKVKRGEVSGFAIKIQGIPFRYEVGRLDEVFLGRSINVFNMSNTGKSLPFEKISSEQTKLPHKVNPRGIAYVRIERSDLENDFGQTTLPFFDSLSVVTTPPSVLGGVGLFHKGVDGFAGVISLRLYPIAYSKYFRNFNNNKVKNGSVLFDRSYEDDEIDYPWIDKRKLLRWWFSNP